MFAKFTESNHKMLLQWSSSLHTWKLIKHSILERLSLSKFSKIKRWWICWCQCQNQQTSIEVLKTNVEFMPFVKWQWSFASHAWVICSFLLSGTDSNIAICKISCLLFLYLAYWCSLSHDLSVFYLVCKCKKNA